MEKSNIRRIEFFPNFIGRRFSPILSERIASKLFKQRSCPTYDAIITLNSSTLSIQKILIDLYLNPVDDFWTEDRIVSLIEPKLFVNTLLGILQYTSDNQDDNKIIDLIWIILKKMSIDPSFKLGTKDIKVLIFRPCISNDR